MVWWVLAIIILIVLGAIGNKLPEPNKKLGAKQRKTPDVNDKAAIQFEAKKIADEVTTLAQYKSLERKFEKLEEKLSEHVGSDKSYDTLLAKCDVLQEAIFIAEDKILRWQFIPYPDINTSLHILKNGYKVFPVQDYDVKRTELGGSDQEWFPLKGDDEPDEKDPELAFPIKFRKIVESEVLTKEEISKKINSLVARNKDDAGDYFDLEGELSPAEQWYTELSENIAS